jgi:hypothetical protein
MRSDIKFVFPKAVNIIVSLFILVLEIENKKSRENSGDGKNSGA